MFLSGSERADLEGAAEGGPGRGLHHEELLARAPGPSEQRLYRNPEGKLLHEKLQWLQGGLVFEPHRRL